MNSIQRFRAAGNHTIWLATLALLSVWLLYGQVIGLALLHDDALIAVDMAHRSLAWIFTPGLSSHYRPASYVWWLAIRALFGRFDSATIYWINLALHCANMALVMRLSRELRRKRRNQITARDICGGLLFGVFPLSYQVLTWSSAMVHETLVLYVLAAGLLWTHLRRNTSRQWLKLSDCFCLGV